MTTKKGPPQPPTPLQVHHVMPKGDLFDHNTTDVEGNCTCGPRIHPVQSPDGRTFIAIQHISLLEGTVPDIVWRYEGGRPVPVLVPPATGPGVPQLA